MRKLTARELAVLESCWKFPGSTDEAVESVGMTKATFNGTLGRVYIKMGVNNKLEAIQKAIRDGLIDVLP